MKPILLATLCLADAAFVAPVWSQYAPYPPAYAYPPPVSAARALPPSWSYDPYTSGQAPCPQGIHDEYGRCRDRMPPTYGQPSYWPVR